MNEEDDRRQEFVLLGDLQGLTYKHIKDPRNVYPGLTPIFSLAGFLLSRLYDPMCNRNFGPLVKLIGKLS